MRLLQLHHVDQDTSQRNGQHDGQPQSHAWSVHAHDMIWQGIQDKVLTMAVFPGSSRTLTLFTLLIMRVYTRFTNRAW